jgi:hypothetical protein
VTSTQQLPDASVVVPDCDCAAKHDGPKLHRPGCQRMAAIVRKWHGADAEQRYLRGERP